MNTFDFEVKQKLTDELTSYCENDPNIKEMLARWVKMRADLAKVGVATPLFPVPTLLVTYLTKSSTFSLPVCRKFLELVDDPASKGKEEQLLEQFLQDAKGTITAFATVVTMINMATHKLISAHPHLAHLFNRTVDTTADKSANSLEITVISKKEEPVTFHISVLNANNEFRCGDTTGRLWIYAKGQGTVSGKDLVNEEGAGDLIIKTIFGD